MDEQECRQWLFVMISYVGFCSRQFFLDTNSGRIIEDLCVHVCIGNVKIGLMLVRTWWWSWGIVLNWCWCFVGQMRLGAITSLWGMYYLNSVVMVQLFV